MRIERIMKVCFLSAVVLMAVTICAGSKSVAGTADDGLGKRSVYCWHKNLIDYDKLDALIERLDSMQVRDVYVCFGTIADHAESIAKLEDNGFKVYYLTGDVPWYKEYRTMQSEINRVADYNKAYPDHPLEGIVFDVEPYADAEYKADKPAGFKKYVETMEAAYHYAHIKGLRFVTVTPYWFDSYAYNEEFSEQERVMAQRLQRRLIRSCDRVSVMNYHKKNMVKNISTEIEYAMQCGKEVESAAEFDHDLEDQDIISFYNESDPFGACHLKWQAVRESTDYDKLLFSYHHLRVIEELYPDE